MTDRSIIFSTPMIRALIAGIKTQTRRILRIPDNLDATTAWADPGLGAGGYLKAHEIGDEDIIQRVYPFCEIGDRLWVRETFGYLGQYDMMPGQGFVYKAAPGRQNFGRWRSPIHMPRSASRITLTATNVRVQRLRDISEEDADAEAFGGDFPHVVLPDLFPDADAAGQMTIMECFAVLWTSIHGETGPKSWEANPWVSAVSFAVELRNIDATVSADEVAA